MAKKKRSTRSSTRQVRAQQSSSYDTPQAMGESYAGLESDRRGNADIVSAKTGRKIVTILSDDPDDKRKVIEYFSARDVKDVVETADYAASAFDAAEVASSEAMVMDLLPIIVLNQQPNVQTALAAAARADGNDDVRRMFVIEDEMRHFPCCPGDGFSPLENTTPPTQGGFGQVSSGRTSGLSQYHEGYLRGVQALAGVLLAGASGAATGTAMSSEGMLAPADFVSCFSDSPTATWGLQATGVETSNLTGNGVRVAILDTGFELGLSDSNFASRIVDKASFVGGTAQDHHGHGTHVAGTACGPANPGMGTRRYGIATESEILIGRVLGPNGGDDTSVLGGINWALGQKCDLINMSLGPRVCQLNPAFSTAHERAARIALNNGVLMIAAAGNNSNRPSRICPVVGPAAAPSIIAVAAVDRCGRVASFSNQGQNTSGGEINFAAPGVDVFSAWINPTRHRDNSGTSMAAPHVTGIAALLAQQTGLRGLSLFRELRDRVKNIGHSPADVGNGFIHV